MAHPIVLMAFDKSPAITKAVAALEEAGLEVVVLNTATAKLVDFLGALAGEPIEDETPTPAPEDESEAETPPEDEREPVETPPENAAPEEAEEDLAQEALKAKVNDEEVVMEIVEGADAVLYTSKIIPGSKTFYQLNETTYSFWPTAVGGEPITESVLVQVGEDAHYIKVVLAEETMSPPVLRIGKEHAFFADK